MPLPSVARLSIAALAAVIAACSTPSLPERRPGILPPAQWSQDTLAEGVSPPSLTAWWRRFDDPLLGELVERALEANTDVRVALAHVREARALREQSLAGLRPTLSASASTQRSDPANAGSSESVQSSVEAGWDLDLFGGGQRGAQASAADLDASNATLAGARLTVAAEVAISYVQLRGSQARLAIARDSLEAQQQTLQITDWRAQAGLASSLEVEQSRAEVAQTQAQLPPLQASVEQSTHALSLLCGKVPLALQATLATAGPIPQAPAQLSLDIPGKALRQRPDVRAAELAVDAAGARVSQARATRLPSFVLRSSVAWSAVSLSQLGGTAARALIGSTNLPLLDGGTRRAQLESQEAQFDAAQATLDATVLAALQDVEDVLSNLRSSRERLQALQRAAQAASNAALLAQHRYASGLVDFQTVLETQRSQLSAQDGVATTEADLAAGHVRLYRALGGGWTPESPSSDDRAGHDTKKESAS